MGILKKKLRKFGRTLANVDRIARAAANPVGAVARKLMTGDARSYFYGDPAIELDPNEVGDELVGDSPAGSATAAAIADTTPSDVEAAARLNAFQQISSSDKARMTHLPVLAIWNGQIKVNPLLGKMVASALNYNLQKALNEYPTAGHVEPGQADPETRRATIQVSVEAGESALAIPFVIVTIAASALNARPGATISINFSGTDEHGKSYSSIDNEGEFSFFRLSTTESIVLVYVPFTKVATRTLPFMPIVNQQQQFTLTLDGLQPDEQVAVTIPGYATRELAQVAKMYNLPAGDIA